MSRINPVLNFILSNFCAREKAAAFLPYNRKYAVFSFLSILSQAVYWAF